MPSQLGAALPGASSGGAAARWRQLVRFGHRAAVVEAARHLTQPEP